MARLVISLVLCAFWFSQNVALSTFVESAEEMSSLRQKVGRLLIIGFNGLTSEEEDVQKAITDYRNGHIGGVILHGYRKKDDKWIGNIQTASQLKKLTKALYEAGIKIIGTDSEGGFIQRLKRGKMTDGTPNGFLVSTPSAEKMGRIYNDIPDGAKIVHELYGDMVAQLKKYGITVNFGPVLDTYNKEDPNNIIRKWQRSFGDSETIKNLAALFIQSHRENGLISCAKHFPDCGTIINSVDPHEKSTFSVLTEESKNIYKFVINDLDVPMIMTTHNIVLGDSSNLPATFSPEIIAILRAMNFSGCTITDDLTMGAIRGETIGATVDQDQEVFQGKNGYTMREILTLSLNAGHDLLLFKNLSQFKDDNGEYKNFTPQELVEIIIEQVKSGQIDPARILESYRKVETLNKLISGTYASIALEGLVRADDPSLGLWEAAAPSEPPLSKTGKAYMTLNHQGFDVLDDTTIEDSWIIQDLMTFGGAAKFPILDVGGAYGGITRLLLKQGATVYYNDIEEKHLQIGIKKISPEMRTKLYLNTQSFPDEMNFAPASLAAVVLHRVLHLIEPDKVDTGIMKAAEWLEPGGKIFIVVLAPQHISYRDKFLTIYEQRWNEGELWPGSGLKASEALPEQAYCLPEFLHVMDERPLRLALEKYGFTVEKADFISMKRFGVEVNRDGRESFGIIGVKKMME